MTNRSTLPVAGVVAAALSCGALAAQEQGIHERTATPDELEQRIAALRAPDAPWREIAWQSCLLDGLAESVRQRKPIILWMFIDRPVDDRRC